MPASLEAVPKARRRVVKLASELKLPLDEPSFDNLELLAGEVIANAIVHTSAPCAVCVLPAGSLVRVEITDADSAEPRPKQAGPDDETGRGLFLVDALAADWGTYQRPEGKVTWFEVGSKTVLADTKRLPATPHRSSRPARPRLRRATTCAPTDALPFVVSMEAESALGDSLKLLLSADAAETRSSAV
ncbi:ATP-binding protein [Streptomyces hygroscopicus]|uniref:ATP-binding protein n=1 Tax=Streptomyces hygroscopicus TaxID=1912 RepID=UPI00131C5BB9|nr:ATP-binding protein [Streptomyces hygroscopicus]